jgi:hypothetical protein
MSMKEMEQLFLKNLLAFWRYRQNILRRKFDEKYLKPISQKVIYYISR